mmetsp:Transcript_11026/g.27833  ORF Transcript_11026/g.27833 Transcript_11026/m.27833 type:complete len:531 (-) Transcript_11026:67-1659(-)
MPPRKSKSTTRRNSGVDSTRSSPVSSSSTTPAPVRIQDIDVPPANRQSRSRLRNRYRASTDASSSLTEQDPPSATLNEPPSPSLFLIKLCSLFDVVLAAREFFTESLNRTYLVVYVSAFVGSLLAFQAAVTSVLLRSEQKRDRHRLLRATLLSLFALVQVLLLLEAVVLLFFSHTGELPKQDAVYSTTELTEPDNSPFRIWQGLLPHVRVAEGVAPLFRVTSESNAPNMGPWHHAVRCLRASSVPATARSAPLLMFLAGMPFSSSSFLKVMDLLRETPLAERYRICSYDRLGYGDSSQPTVESRSASQLVTELHSVMVDMAADAIDASVLVGWSFGGALAQVYAAQYPVAQIVLVDSLLGDDEQRSAELSSLIDQGILSFRFANLLKAGGLLRMLYALAGWPAEAGGVPERVLERARADDDSVLLALCYAVMTDTHRKNFCFTAAQELVWLRQSTVETLHAQKLLVARRVPVSVLVASQSDDQAHLQQQAEFLVHPLNATHHEVIDADHYLPLSASNLLVEALERSIVIR